MVETKKRKILGKLLKEKRNNKIIILLGPRQVGKTTILKEVHSQLSGLFLDLDILENYDKVSSYTNLINLLKLNGYEENQKEMFYLFLDEFQRYADLSKIMKNVYDNHKNIKIYSSGSSSLKIKEQIQESLAGRKVVYHLYPLDFEEFLWFKEDEKAITQLNNLWKIRGENLKIGILKDLLYEYLVYGGYPEVVLSKKVDKIKILKSIFDLYVKKELVGYLKFGKILGVKKLIEFLAVNNGQKIKYEETADRCSLKQYEVKEYVEILNETFLINIIKPFYTNKNKEIVKIPKIYFLDNGVRNFFINDFNELKLRNDSGSLFEGFVMQELLKGGVDNLKFWQDKQKHEVDFIIDLISRQIPIEIKFKKKLKYEDFIGLNTFLESHKASKKYLVNIGIQNKIKKINLVLPFKLKNLINI